MFFFDFCTKIPSHTHFYAVARASATCPMTRSWYRRCCRLDLQQLQQLRLLQQHSIRRALHTRRATWIGVPEITTAKMKNTSLHSYIPNDWGYNSWDYIQGNAVHLISTARWSLTTRAGLNVIIIVIECDNILKNRYLFCCWTWLAKQIFWLLCKYLKILLFIVILRIRSGIFKITSSIFKNSVRSNLGSVASLKQSSSCQEAFLVVRFR